MKYRVSVTFRGFLAGYEEFPCIDFHIINGVLHMICPHQVIIPFTSIKAIRVDALKDAL